jgi:squalene monooxygenase
LRGLVTPQVFRKLTPSCSFSLTPEPVKLFCHFFAVAFYSLWILFTQPSGGRKTAPSVLEYPALTVQSFRVVGDKSLVALRIVSMLINGRGLFCQFWTACVVILPVIWSEMKA